MGVNSLPGTLPPKQARAIRETKIDGLDAADRHEMSELDVKISVHRGLKSLAARLALSW